MKTKELYRKFNITLVVSLLCVLFITAMINLLVNPYNIFGVPACKLTYLKPESKTQERVTKLIGIKFDQRKLDSIFLGSTRVDTAIAKDYFYKLTGKEAENMAINGMPVEEIQDWLQIIVTIHPEVRNVYLGVDFDMFNESENTYLPIKTKPTLTSKEISMALFSFAGLRDSLSTVTKNITNQTENTYMPNGTKYRASNPKIKNAFSTTLEESSFTYKHFKYNPEKLNYVKFMKEFCDDRGTNFYVFVMPTHITDLQLMQDINVYFDYLAWKSDLSQISSVFDFQFPTPYSNEKIAPDMKYFFDSTNATYITGNLILDYMLNDNPVFGRVYTPDYADIFNNADITEMDILAGDNSARTKFIEAAEDKEN